MTDADRKFLTEAMGECWHEWGPPALTPGLDRCIKCDGLRYKARWDEPCTFTTWADFGAVWEWAQKQGWWRLFVVLNMCADIVDPLRFPQLVVDFLKEAKP